MSRAALAAVALGAGTTWNMSSVGSIADPTAAAYGVSLLVVGLFTGALVLSHLIVQLPAGRAADRIGPGRVAVVAAGLCLLGNAVALIAPNPSLALIGRAITGLGSGAGFVAGADLVRAANLSSVWRGGFGASTMFGGGLAVAIVPQLEPWLGWRAPYWSGAAIAIALVLLTLTIPLLPRIAHGAGLVLDRRLGSLGLIHAASFGVSYLAAGWIVTLFERHGIDQGTAAAVGALVLLGGIVTRIGGGFLMTRRPERARAALAASLVGGGTAALLLALPLPLGVHALATLLAGLSAGLPFAIVFGAAQALRPDAPAAAVAFVNSFAILLLLIGTPLAALAFSLPGDGRLAFASIGVVCLLTLPAARRAYLPESGTKSLTSSPV